MAKLSLLLIFLFSLVILNGQNVPIDFEQGGNGADWTWTTFENGSNPPLEIIPNPDKSGLNTSETVAKFTALQVGQPFAGCESLHGAGIGSFTISADNSIIRILVWKSDISDVGIKLVRVDNWSLGEIKISNTLVNEWEQLEFDFSGHIGNTYDQIVIFPDFDPRSADRVIYFDGVYGEVAVASSNVDLTEKNEVLFPNPTSDILQIQLSETTRSVIIYNIAGQEIYSTNNSVESIDVSQWESGIYVAKIIGSNQLSTHQIVIQ